MQCRTYELGVLKLHVVAVALVALLLATTGLGRAAASSSNAPDNLTGLTPSVTVSSTYRLAPYDVIDVSVYGEDELRTRTKLGSDGSAVLPLIGAVDLEGKTVNEANALIQKKYADGFVKDPHILLTVVEYRKNTFAIMGEVGRPGIYEIPEGVHMTIVDAILLAGGFSHSADRNGVRVKRTVKGKAQIFKVRAGAMADSADVVPFEIEPNDVISVRESWW